MYSILVMHKRGNTAHVNHLSTPLMTLTNDCQNHCRDPVGCQSRPRSAARARRRDWESKLHQPSWRRKRKLEKEHTTNILLQRRFLLTEHQFAQPCAGATSIASPPNESRWAPFIFHPLSHFPQVAKKPWKIHFDASLIQGSR